VTGFPRAALLAAFCVLAAGRAARADIIVTPFVGKTFAAQTILQTSETGVDERKWIFGASATWLSSGILGAELDLGYAPRFFDAGRLINRPGSNVTTLTGNVVLAAPLSVTRESLRPYLSVGLGLLHVGVDDLIGLTTIDRNLAALSVGGGAIGFLTERTGLRFDVRRIRSLSSGVDLDSTSTASEPRLGFWRATVGVALRY
jgi:hypothetical protein